MVDMKSLLTMQAMMFLMILTGAFFRKRGLITAEGRKSLTNIVVHLILPCNILYAFSRADSSLFSSLMAVVIMAVVLQLAWYVLSKVLWKKMPESRRGVMRYAFQFSNCGFLGNPVIEGLYGSQGLIYASIYLIPIRIFMWSIGLESFQEKSGSFLETMRKIATHPCILATAAGVLWMFFPVTLPEFLQNTIYGLNQCLTPFTMLIIGSILAEANLKEMFCRDIYVLSLLRLVIQPLIALGLCRMLHLETLVAEVVTVLVAMPVASTTAILASQHDCDATFASNAVVFTTVLSLITIPLFSLLVGLVF